MELYDSISENKSNRVLQIHKYKSIYTESKISNEEGIEAIQAYVDDNYNTNTLKVLEVYCLQNQFKTTKPINAYRGIIFPKAKSFLDSVDAADGQFIDSEGISFTTDIEEAEAFAAGENIYSYSGKNKNNKLDDMEGAVFKVKIPANEILIDVKYCIQKGLLDDVEWIEENEIIVIKKPRKLKIVDAIDPWGWWSLTDRKF